MAIRRFLTPGTQVHLVARHHFEDGAIPSCRRTNSMIDKRYKRVFAVADMLRKADGRSAVKRARRRDTGDRSAERLDPQNARGDDATADQRRRPTASDPLRMRGVDNHADRHVRRCSAAAPRVARVTRRFRCTARVGTTGLEPLCHRLGTCQRGSRLRPRGDLGRRASIAKPAVFCSSEPRTGRRSLRCSRGWRCSCWAPVRGYH